LSQGTPRTAQASLLTGSEGTYQTMAGQQSFPGQQLTTQNSSHSGVQYALSPAALSPANSPRYAVSQVTPASFPWDLIWQEGDRMPLSKFAAFQWENTIPAARWMGDDVP